ncbi:hypothetical protein AB0C61_20255 [Streptomyces sp. NPDC048680]
MTGDASNVEYGLEALLTHQLFPMLSGHGADEEADDRRREARLGVED